MTGALKDSLHGYCEQLSRIVNDNIAQMLTTFSAAPSPILFNQIREQLESWQRFRLAHIGRALAATRPEATFIDLFNDVLHHLGSMGYHLSVYPSIYGNGAHLSINTIRGLHIVQELLNGPIATDKIASIELSIYEKSGQTLGTQWLAEILSKHSFSGLRGLTIQGDGEISTVFPESLHLLKYLNHFEVKTKSNDAAQKVLSSIADFTTLKSLDIAEVTSDHCWEILSTFSSLSSLSLFAGNIGKAGCKAMRNLENLQHLGLSLWGRKHSEIKTVKSLHRLESLNLANNEIPAKSFQELWALSSLKNLNLYDTKISTTTINGIENLLDLNVVNLGMNNLGDASFAVIGKLPQVVSINLENSGLKEPDIHLLRNRASIKELTLANNNLQDDTLKDIKSFSSLRSLSLNHINRNAFTNSSINATTSLCELELRAINLQADDLEALKGLNQLRQLDLFNNPNLSDHASKYIRSLVNLTNLDIGNTGFTSSGFNDLAPLTKLHCLRAVGNKFDQGIDVVKQLPALHWIDLGKCFLNETSYAAVLGSTAKEMWLYNNPIDDRLLSSMILSLTKILIEINLRGSISPDLIQKLQIQYPYANIPTINVTSR